MERKEKKLSRLILLVVLLIWTGANSFGQLACENTLPETFTHPWRNGWAGFPVNAWNGFVFQLDSNYNPSGDTHRDFVAAGAQAFRKYKGYLIRDNNHFLPTTGLNFDTEFSDYSLAGDDMNMFQTGLTPTTSDGCETVLEDFGVLMRSRYIVPSPGIYRIRIGSDDGSFFRVYRNANPNDLYLDLNGNPLIHNNWFKDPASPNFDGVFNFVYEDNIRNYYVEFEGGEVVYIQLNYYEKSLISRLSFEFDLYFGPGEVKIASTSTGIASYCGINPNPPAFQSTSPAVFESGVGSTYQWQYALTNSGATTWIDIPAANSTTYDIPAYVVGDPESWTGTRYFRRGATNQIVNDDGTVTEVDVFSNVLQINLEAIENLDQQEFGDNQWIGHIYNGARTFSSANYLGRDTESIIFDQRFGGYIGPSSPIFYSPEHGCSVIFDNKTVRYKMRMDVQPGTYQFRVNGDDGYRLYLNGILTSINEWTKSSGPKPSPDIIEYDVIEAGQIELILEYYELGGNQRITFDYDFTSTALPVEWGQILGMSCGENNCLTWETLQEKYTSHFIIERSYDGLEWFPIGEAIAAQGFSTQATIYQVVDDSFKQERSFYRVKQVDIDGTMDYSETIRIDNPSFQKKMMPYPNPTVDRVRFYSEDEVLLLQVSSFSGNVNYRAAFDSVGQHLYELDLSNQHDGQYVITVVTKSSRVSHKIVKK